MSHAAEPFRLAVLDDYQGVALRMADWSPLADRVAVSVFTDHVADEVQLVNRLQPFNGILAMRERTPFPASVLARLPHLQLLVTKSMANAAIDVAAAQARGITVCGTTGWEGATSTVELAWGLILSLARGIPRQDAAIRNAGWQVGIGVSLAGRTLGIVGLGNLGPLMVPIGRAFGMRVVAWSRNLTDARAAEAGAERLDREEFFSSCDVITVHLKLGTRSRGYIGADELALMRPTALLVNTSRGPVVDEKALIDALRNGRIAGAALDVYDQEPLPLDHPLRYLPNTVLTPHVGYVTEESYRRHFEEAVEDVCAYLDGQPVRIVDTG